MNSHGPNTHKMVDIHFSRAMWTVALCVGPGTSLHSLQIDTSPPVNALTLIKKRKNSQEWMKKFNLSLVVEYNILGPRMREVGSLAEPS
jgi:hypothetical protein